MDYVKSREIGNSDLSVATTTALANLLVAVNKSELTNVCVVISDLTASYEGGTDQLNKALANLQKETNRSALRIEPVNPHGDELYHILRTRLFETLPDAETIKTVANEYAKAVRDAKEMDVTNASPDSYAAQLIESYPFHFSIRDLYGRFKENPGFQQTRGLIRMMRIFVSNMYDNGRAEQVKLIHPYDIDLNNDEIFSEIKSINPTLSEAITHDIAKAGHSVAEELDSKLGSNSDAQDVCKLLLIASLANIPGATHGLRESDIMAFLCAPGRDISNVKKSIVDYLPTQAWYLHASQDGRLFFKNTQNLAAKLHSLAESYNKESCIKELRIYLANLFTPGLKDCYQKVAILPGVDEVNIEADKITLVITEPTTEPNAGSRLSPDWDKFANDIEYKNRVIFLTGSHDTLGRVVEQAAQHKAVLSILMDFDTERLADNDPQRQRALISQDKIMLSLRSAIQETFTTLSYPSKNGFRSTDCRIQFQNNQFDGEQLIRDTLEKLQKFTNDITGDTFRKKCEARLFGGQQTAPWSEIKRRAATLTTWQFHRPDGLQTLKNTAIGQDRWREDGGYIDKGPFPPPETEVRVQRLSRDETSGEAALKITPVHGDTVYYETGNNTPTTASARIESFSNFKTSELQLTLLCVDSTNEHNTGSSESWKNSINLKHKVYQQGDDWMVELKAYPRGDIRYTTDGSDPNGFGAAYETPFPVTGECPFVLAIARQGGVSSAQERINVKQYITKEVKVDPGQKLTWRHRHANLTAWAAFKFMERLSTFQGTAYGVTVDVQANDDSQDINYTGAETFGIRGGEFKKLVEQLQAAMNGSQIFLTIERVQFDRGQHLLDWIADAKDKLQPGDVSQ